MSSSPSYARWRFPETGETEWYPAGRNPASVPPGALVLVRHDAGAAPWIRFGERMDARRRHRANPLLDLEEELSRCWCNHAGLTTRDGKLSEQVARGNVLSDLSKYEAALVAVVPILYASPEQLDLVLARVDWCSESRYSFIGDVVQAVDMLDGARSFAGGGLRMFCSEMSAYCLSPAGLQPDKLDPEVLPSDLSRYARVAPAPALLAGRR